MAAVQTIINAALLVAQNKANLADAYTGQAILLANAPRPPVTVGAISDVNVREPNVNIPSRVSGMDTAVFDSMYGKIINDLSDKFAQFLTRYFPIRATLMPEVEAWLERAITAGGTGINAWVERQIWQRDRDRISAEASSASEEVMSRMAARGFPLPSGALNAGLISVQRKRSAGIAAVSRDAAIKAFETEVENVRFAVEQAIRYRTAAIAAAGDYIKALAVAPNIASSLSTQSADAQAKLISAAASFYNARTNAEEAGLRADIAREDFRHKAEAFNSGMVSDRAKLQVQAAVSAAESIGQQAAAALNGLNSTAQLVESVG